MLLCTVFVYALQIKTSGAFNRVLFWLDNEILDENTPKPTKNEEVRQKELIALLKKFLRL